MKILSHECGVMILSHECRMIYCLMNVDMVTALQYVVADCLSVKNVESTSHFLASYNKRKLYCFFIYSKSLRKNIFIFP